MGHRAAGHKGTVFDGEVGKPLEPSAPLFEVEKTKRVGGKKPLFNIAMKGR